MTKKIMALAVIAMMGIQLNASAQKPTKSADKKVAKKECTAAQGSECKKQCPQLCDSVKCKKENCKKENCQQGQCKKQAKTCKQGQQCQKGQQCQQGQQCKKGGEGRERMAKEFSYDYTTLNLTADQQAKVTALDNAMQTSRRELREQAREQKDSVKTDRRAQAKDLKVKYLKDMRTILTADQYVQFLEDNYVNQGSKQGQHPAQMKQGQKGQKGPKAQCDKQNCNKQAGKPGPKK